MPNPSPAAQEAIIVRFLPKGTTVVNVLGTANVGKPPGAKGKSWIQYYRDNVAKTTKGAPVQLVCCAEGCSRADRLSGGHVKIAMGPTTAALLHTKWYVVPECPAHNKGASCKTFRVKPVLAVEATPVLQDRVVSWKADVKKLFNAITGKGR
jgi:hypothetical protein